MSLRDATAVPKLDLAEAFKPDSTGSPDGEVANQAPDHAADHEPGHIVRVKEHPPSR